MTLHPDIPEQGPRIGTPADHDPAGFFVGGPMPARPWGLLELIKRAYVAPEAPTPDTTRATKRAKRHALKARRRAELVALCAAIRARLAA